MICVTADFCLARGLIPNSDSVQSYNEMLSIHAGNVLLHHWVLTTDDFLLTDLMPMLMASVVLGTNDRLIYLIPFLVFVAMLGTSILIVRSRAATRAGRLAGSYAMLLLLGVPYGLLYNFFFWSDFHVATITLCLIAIWAVAPAFDDQALRRWRVAVFVGLIFATSFSDPLAACLLGGPVILLVAVRAWAYGAFRPAEWLVAACAMLGSVGGPLALHLIVRTDASFTIAPSVSLDFVPTAAAALRDMHAIVAGTETLFTARSRLIRTLPLHGVIAASRMATAIAVASLCGAILWRLPRARHSGVAQLLVAGALCVGLLAALSATFANAIGPGLGFPGAAVRFTVPIFVFLCVAAALEFADVVARFHPRWLFGVMIGLGLVHATGAAVAAVRAAEAPRGIDAGADPILARWLLANGLVYGVGDYWDTQLVEAFTSGAVKADPVVNVGNHLSLWAWLTDTGRFGPQNPPQFAIIRPAGLFRVDLASITATYGAPLSITEVAQQFFVCRLKGGGSELSKAPPPRTSGSRSAR